MKFYKFLGILKCIRYSKIAKTCISHLVKPNCLKDVKKVFHYKIGKSSTYPARGLASIFPFAPSNNYTKAGTQALPTDFISLHILALNFVVGKLGNDLTMFSEP